MEAKAGPPLRKLESRRVLKSQPLPLEEEAMMKLESDYIGSARSIARHVTDLAVLLKLHDKKATYTIDLENHLEELSAKER
jgi:hypothetical protein